MKQLFITLGVFIIIISVLGYFYQRQNPTKDNPIISSTKDDGNTVKIGDRIVFVEEAITNSQKAQGLSGRKYLGKDDGMLFDLRNDNFVNTFWMKDMLIPIDIIWIKDGGVVQIDSNVPPPPQGTSESELIRYSANQHVDYVLEVNAGYSENNNINVGSVFEIIQD